ncbi:hypothetical protein, partial [Streptomyces ipomoeae]|uniref:hypothetical protein n=1 Tax=Streptomyces ipomoeae TaxID=103232 RepID=UPI001F16777F
MKNFIVWLLGVLAVLRITQPRSRGGSAPAPGHAVPTVPHTPVRTWNTPPETPRQWHLNPDRARWARWARRAERLRWSGRGLPLLPEEECWQRGSVGRGRRGEASDWGRCEARHPVRTYVLVALGE